MTNLLGSLRVRRISRRGKGVRLFRAPYILKARASFDNQVPVLKPRKLMSLPSSDVFCIYSSAVSRVFCLCLFFRWNYLTITCKPFGRGKCNLERLARNSVSSDLIYRYKLSRCSLSPNSLLIFVSSLPPPPPLDCLFLSYLLCLCCVVCYILF